MSYVISRPWGDACGIGHQFHNWVVAWQLAKKYNLQFVHSPFCGDKIQPQIDVPVRQWEKFLGFGHQELYETDLPKNIQKIKLPFLPWDESSWYKTTLDREEWQDIIIANRDKNVLFECAKNQFIVSDNRYMDFEKLRNKYSHTRSINPRNNHLIDDYVNVAVHIRRGDVTENGRYKVRWLSNDFYINIMHKLQDIFQKSIIFHIYTDGDSKDVEQIYSLNLFENMKIYLRGSNVFQVFHNMTKANILIFGKSQFSVLAALLNPNIKIGYKWSPHCEFPRNEFIETDLNGSFNVNELWSKMIYERYCL